MANVPALPMNSLRDYPALSEVPRSWCDAPCIPHDFAGRNEWRPLSAALFRRARLNGMFTDDRKMCVVLQHNLGKGCVPPPLHPPAYRRIQTLSLPTPVGGELGRSPVNRRRCAPAVAGNPRRACLSPCPVWGTGRGELSCCPP